MILILVSFEKIEHAERAANYLIDQKLAACVELYPVKNFYVWKGEKMAANEVSGIIKTEEDKFEPIKNELQKLLGYEIPQIIKVDATANESYLAWVKKAVGS